jgi:hypothetical protein
MSKATEVSNEAPAEFSIVVMQFPPFYTEELDVLFVSADAQFTLAGITEERTTFYHSLSQLDHRYVREVRDIVISPSQQDPYTKLKTELLNRLSPSREKRTCSSRARRWETASHHSSSDTSGSSTLPVDYHPTSRSP